MQLHGVLAIRLCFCPGRGEGGALEALMPHLASSDVPRSPGTPLVPPGSGRACVRKHPGLYTCARQGGKQDRVGARGQPRSPAVQMKASADPTWSSGVTMVHGSGLSGGRGLASYPVSASPSRMWDQSLCSWRPCGDRNPRCWGQCGPPPPLKDSLSPGGAAVSN